MNVPQLWQKWQTMIAQTSLRESSARQGIERARGALLVLATM